MESEVIPYLPSALYFRRALRGAKTKADAVEVGLTAVAELENLKAWVREQGFIPPKCHLLKSETEEKGWIAS